MIGFTLIDARAEEDVRVLSDGDTIDLEKDGYYLTIRADTVGSAVSSVVFDFDDSSGVRTENVCAILSRRRPGGRPLPFQ